MSPAKTKLGCWLLVVDALVLEALLLDGRNSIQGTATCFPEELELPVELDSPLELPEVLELLDDPAPVDELPGEVALPDAPELPDELSEITAKSIRPEAGLMIVSLIVPN